MAGPARKEITMKEYLDVLKKYAVFTGRARRREYWMFTLFNALAGAVVWGIAMVGLWNDNYVGVFPYMAYCLATFLPGLAVFVRRMHDTGRSGWWFLLMFIPLVGAIVVLVFLCTEGQPGDNKYGPDPKAA
jgi:uncharacterized membrane protein YhaH (DUF805 family)